MVYGSSGQLLEEPEGDVLMANEGRVKRFAPR